MKPQDSSKNTDIELQKSRRRARRRKRLKRESRASCQPSDTDPKESGGVRGQGTKKEQPSRARSTRETPKPAPLPFTRIPRLSSAPGYGDLLPYLPSPSPRHPHYKPAKAGSWCIGFYVTSRTRSCRVLIAGGDNDFWCLATQQQAEPPTRYFQVSPLWPMDPHGGKSILDGHITPLEP